MADTKSNFYIPVTFCYDTQCQSVYVPYVTDLAQVGNDPACVLSQNFGTYIAGLWVRDGAGWRLALSYQDLCRITVGVDVLKIIVNATVAVPVTNNDVVYKNGQRQTIGTPVAGDHVSVWAVINFSVLTQSLVTSVAGRTGDIVLTAADIAGLPMPLSDFLLTDSSNTVFVARDSGTAITFVSIETGNAYVPAGAIKIASATGQHTMADSTSVVVASDQIVPTEPLGVPGVAVPPITAGIVSVDTVLTSTCRRISLKARTVDQRYSIGTVAQTASATNSHYIEAGERLDLAIPAGAHIAIIRDSLATQNGTMCITEYL